MSKTNPARGMRDFLPADVRKREYVIGIIKQVYESYGFEPLETPAVENIETLMGKYGEEGNQLVFKILKRGEKLGESLDAISRQETSGSSLQSPVSRLSDLALRYDLTVPLARVVADRRNELPKFFKRYQIQPVWRADRPARGRFREFYQCDVDAIGSSSAVVEADILASVCEIMDQLKFTNYSILLNHRELLRGALDVCGIDGSQHTDALIALDKLDKVGKQGVSEELKTRGFESQSIQRMETFIDTMFRESINVVGEPYDSSGDPDIDRIKRNESLNFATLDQLSKFIGNSPSGAFGLNKISEILSLTSKTSAAGRIDVFPNLARGLTYYTGAIMELGVPHPSGDHKYDISLGGGGRYDGLIGMFGKEQIPACGFSLGLERILVVMDERGMFPPEIAESAPADVMVTLWSDETAAASLKLAAELRSQALRVTVYPEPDKFGKQMKYADAIRVPFVCILGPDEIEKNVAKLKSMRTGEEMTANTGQIAENIRQLRPDNNQK